MKTYSISSEQLYRLWQLQKSLGMLHHIGDPHSGVPRPQIASFAYCLSGSLRQLLHEIGGYGADPEHIGEAEDDAR